MLFKQLKYPQSEIIALLGETQPFVIPWNFAQIYPARFSRVQWNLETTVGRLLTIMWDLYTGRSRFVRTRLIRNWTLSSQNHILNFTGGSRLIPANNTERKCGFENKYLREKANSNLRCFFFQIKQDPPVLCSTAPQLKICPNKCCSD